MSIPCSSPSSTKCKLALILFHLFLSIRLIQRGYLWWCRLRISIDLLFRIVSSSISFRECCNDAWHGIVYASPTTLNVSESSVDLVSTLYELIHAMSWFRSRNGDWQEKVHWHAQLTGFCCCSMSIVMIMTGQVWRSCTSEHTTVVLRSVLPYSTDYGRANFKGVYFDSLCVFSLLAFFFSFLHDILLCDFFEFEYFVVFWLRPSDWCSNLVVRPLLEDGVRLISEFFILYVSNP